VLKFLVARAGQAILVVFVVVTLSFALAHAAPGDPFFASDDATMDNAARQHLRERWGYDQPVWRQYGRWLANIGTGDLGWSHSRSMPVSAVLRDAVPNTIALMVPAIALGLLFGVALGTWQGARRGHAMPRIADSVSLTLVSVPDFVLALGVLSLFAMHWGLAPTSGMIDPVRHDTMSFAQRTRDVIAHLVLPGGTLALLIAASVSRYQRVAVIGVLREDYLRTAHATGATEWRVIVRHALRNALGPVIAIGGLMIPTALSGTVLIEKVFAWPGMGLTIVEAVGGRDYALVQAVVLIGALMVVAGGAVADLCAAAANPRIRLDA
jgi:peptide/nickel transport system permease protein